MVESDLNNLNNYVVRWISLISHRPTLITTSIVFWRICILFHEKKAGLWAGHEPTSSVTLISAHRPTHLRYGELRLGLNWLGFITMQLNYWPCVIVCVGFGWLGTGMGPFKNGICICIEFAFTFANFHEIENARKP